MRKDGKEVAVEVASGRFVHFFLLITSRFPNRLDVGCGRAEESQG